MANTLSYVKLIRPPSQFLGGKLCEVVLENGTKAWAIGSCQYVQFAVKNEEDYLGKSGEKLPYKAPLPLSSGYCPEINVSPELGEVEALLSSLGNTKKYR